MTIGLKFKGGFELIAVVEDLKTLHSTAAVRIYVVNEDGTFLHDVIAFIEVPD